VSERVAVEVIVAEIVAELVTEGVPETSGVGVRLEHPAAPTSNTKTNPNCIRRAKGDKEQ
jgi:hypothetical protein